MEKAKRREEKKTDEPIEGNGKENKKIYWFACKSPLPLSRKRRRVRTVVRKERVRKAERRGWEEKKMESGRTIPEV